MIPKDPMILLSFVNTHLRDHYSSLEELCSAQDIDRQELVDKLEKIDYVYDAETNQFI
jgi:hypothetical protein